MLNMFLSTSPILAYCFLNTFYFAANKHKFYLGKIFSYVLILPKNEDCI